MRTFKAHEEREHRDDAMVLDAETPLLAAEDYARRYLSGQLEQYGPQIVRSDYVILVRVPGGKPTRFRAYPTPGGDVAVRVIHD